MDYALAFVGSPFTVGTVEEKRVCPTLRLPPQWSQVRWSQRLLSSVPLSTMLTVMATALWCVWVAHCSHAPEPTQVASAERRHRRLNVSICEKVMGQSCADYPHHFWLLNDFSCIGQSWLKVVELDQIRHSCDKTLQIIPTHSTFREHQFQQNCILFVHQIECFTSKEQDSYFIYLYQQMF